MKKLFYIFLLLLIVIPLASSVTIEQREEYKSCRENCSSIKISMQLECKSTFSDCRSSCNGNRTCTSTCSKEQSLCLRQANSNTCMKECRQIISPKCLFNNQTYKIGDSFIDGCSSCKCSSSGRISCKTDNFCNKNVTISESLCNDSGGRYYSLCNGPYFGIVCTSKKFCLCEGNNNYTCPEEYHCMKDFVSPNKRSTIEGWKDLIGQPLGDIGICAK